MKPRLSDQQRRRVDQLREPKTTAAFNKAVAFIPTTLAVLTRPRAFFASRFHVAQDSDQRRAVAITSFDYLGIAITLHALIMPLHHALLRAGGFPEHFLRLAAGGSQAFVEQYERMTGRSVIYVDLSQVTGMPLVDSLIEDSARIVMYAGFAGLFWLFSGGKLPIKRMMDYFAYVVGASIVVDIVFILLGDAYYALQGGANPSSAFAILSGIQQLGSIPRILFLFVIPSVILPGIFSVRRRVVVWATMLAAATWGIAGMVLSLLMFSAGVIIFAPGL